MNGFYLHSFFRSLSILGRCLKNLNTPAPKIGALQIGSKTQMAIFLKTLGFSLNFSNLW
jgi:hypothetical protein